MDFFTQFEALKLRTPRVSSIVINSINSDYNYGAGSLKNCYLLANAVGNENCMYGRDFYNNADCVDCAHIAGCTLCYECGDCVNCYDCIGLQDSENCQNCICGYDLAGCRDCIACVGLRKKQYCIFNRQYSREEFENYRKNMTAAHITEGFETLKRSVPRRTSRQRGTENCFGDGILNSQNAFECFDISDCRDIGYCAESKNLADCWDIFILEDSQLCYEISSSHKLYNCNFCFQCVSSSSLVFCEYVFNSHDCFGCVGRNHAEYEILNVKYPKEEYAQKVAEIKTVLKAARRYENNLTSAYPLEDTVALWKHL